MSLIAVTHLAKQYPDGTQALRDASFSIEPGEFVAIMGPSGSGKSTLLHILGFLDPQTSGEYRFQERLSTDIAPRELARLRNEELGFVFQQFNLLPRESVFDNVVMPLYYTDVAERLWKDRANRAIHAVGLAHRRDHDAFMLSGGEKQRVAIARALINEPSVIFADEPTGNLDSASGEQVMEILTGLNTAGNTIVLITHDEEIAKRSRRILTIRDGRLIRDTATI